MLASFYTFSPMQNNCKKINNTNIKQQIPLNKIKHDSFCFKGMSQASEYKNVFQYLAADILSKQKKYGVDGSLLSATNITKGVENVFNNDKVYPQFSLCKIDKIKWKSYVPKDVREFCVDKINEARTSRLNEWKNFLENPLSNPTATNYPKLISNISKRKPLKFVIWNAITSELKDNNRHIPVPFNAKALAQTVNDFDSIPAISRKVRCTSPSFIEMYTHRLRDNLLVEKGVSTENAVWIKIPSIKKNPLDKEKNISDLETLSCKNWCTRSSIDKAEAALEEGDFYIYLERDKKNNLWQPLIGMASHQNKIDQIQGVENNNIIPLNQVENVANFIKEKGLKCQSGIIDEGPKAYQQILISQKLLENRHELGKSFEKAIKDEDSFAIFKYLNKPVKQTEDGKLIIDSYKPAFLANEKSGITIPYNMMGINEDTLLYDVKEIKGDLILANKNKLYSSSIQMFPANLEKVSGKIVCNKAQYEKFGDEINKVITNKKNITIFE